MILITDYTKLYNLPGLMVTTDFEKVFDSLSWNVLFRTLEISILENPLLSGYVFFILIYRVEL